MNKNLYRKLALQNIKTNKSTFLPFMLCSIAMVAMFYMLSAIATQVNGAKFYGSSAMSEVLAFGTVVCGIFSFFVILYTNSFIMKRRAKEFGLYSMLGMDKIHIGKIVFWEISIVGCGSIVAGIISGLIFSKLMFMIFLHMLRVQSGIKFVIDGISILTTLFLFAAVFVFAVIFNFIRVLRLKPIELMRSTRAGEKEPKANWVVALLGVVCLAVGYFIAVTMKNPVSALTLFFVAVLFVMAGTYLLFISGSVALLKLLKKNKNFYYSKNNFITVSGLIYRMKQNAVGLANICILSTAVLVVLSSTISLYVGSEEMIRNHYPSDVSINFSYLEGEEGDSAAGNEKAYDYSVLPELVLKYVDKYNVKVINEQSSYSHSLMGAMEGNRFDTGAQDFSNMAMVNVMIADDYNKMSGENIALNEDEILAYSSAENGYSSEELWIGDMRFLVKGKLDKKFTSDDVTLVVNDFVTIVVKDMDVLKELRKLQKAAYDNEYTTIKYEYAFDLKGSEADKIQYCKKLRKALGKTELAHFYSLDDIFEERYDMLALFGSLYFIGIFIGTLFIITTIMIIYYKQISEGYEDRERFTILKKVGMSDLEVKNTIKRQILLVFFLPIIIAVIHICVAFSAIRKIMVLFALTNVTVLVTCTIGTIAFFFILYAISYLLTARTYYKLVYAD